MHARIVLVSFIVGLCALSSAQSAGRLGGGAGTPPYPWGENCRAVGASHTMSFVPGASTVNTFVTTADPELRKFIVYVPSSYPNGRELYPLVYMFHGTGQSALNALQNTTWNHAAEVGDFIAVYPEALPYLLMDGTVRTKWRTDAVEEFVVDPSELPMADDTLFVRELHNTLIEHLAVDCEHVYASGFSNGGGFVKSEVRIHLPDIFAATTSGGGLGATGGIAADYFPANGIDFRPHFEVVGTRDSKKIDNCIASGDLDPGDILPRAVAEVIALPCMWGPLTLFAEGTGQDSQVYSTIEQQNFTQFLWNTTLLPGPGPTEYRFHILPNLGHEYPSGNNYPTDYVPIFWTWMQQYSR